MPDIEKVVEGLEKAKTVIETWVPIFEQYNSPFTIDCAVELLKAQQLDIEALKDELAEKEQTIERYRNACEEYQRREDDMKGVHDRLIHDLQYMCGKYHDAMHRYTIAPEEALEYYINRCHDLEDQLSKDGPSNMRGDM